MAIPRFDHTLTHVDRTVVRVPPATVFRELIDLAGLLGDCGEIRVESWPDGGLGVPDAAFWAVHWAAPSSGHAVEYRLTESEPPTSLALRARSDLYEAAHRVVVAPAAGGGSEIAWAVTLDPDRAATQQLVEDASLLATAVLRGLDLLEILDLEVDEPVART